MKNLQSIQRTIQLEKEATIGMMKTEERITPDTTAYNPIRLYNIKQEIKNTTENLGGFRKIQFLTRK